MRRKNCVTDNRYTTYVSSFLRPLKLQCRVNSGGNESVCSPEVITWGEAKLILRGEAHRATLTC